MRKPAAVLLSVLLTLSAGPGVAAASAAVVTAVPGRALSTLPGQAGALMPAMGAGPSGLLGPGAGSIGLSATDGSPLYLPGTLIPSVSKDAGSIRALGDARAAGTAPALSVAPGRSVPREGLRTGPALHNKGKTRLGGACAHEHAPGPAVRRPRRNRPQDGPSHAPRGLREEVSARSSLAEMENEVRGPVRPASPAEGKLRLDRLWEGAALRTGGASSVPVMKPDRLIASGLERRARHAGWKTLFAAVPAASVPVLDLGGAAAKAAELLSALPEWSLTAAAVVGILAATWLAARLAKRVSRWVFDRTNLDPLMESWLTRGSAAVVWIAGAGTALGVLGVSASSLAASAGAWSLALGLAVKDSVQNIVSGFVLFFNRPFRVGDRVRLLGEEGTVASIDTRFVTLDTSENGEAGYERVLIPNQKLLQEKIFTAGKSALLGGLGFLGAWKAAALPYLVIAGKVGAVLAGTWLTARLVRRLARRALGRSSAEKAMADWYVTLASMTAWVLGLLVLLNVLGVSLSALVTSLGVVSIALGFMMKDFTSNLVAGLMLAVYRPFRLGDSVMIKGEEGTVEDITHRYVRLRLADGDGLRFVDIPNSELMNEKIRVGKKQAPSRQRVFPHASPV